MKTLLISLALTLVSSLSLASGFVCQGEGYTVRLYNEVQPAQGTQNPAVLIVSSQQMGTIAVLRGAQIEKFATGRALFYNGQTRDVHTGRFISTELAIARTPTIDSNEPERLAHLKLVADGGEFNTTLVCEQYLKN